MMGMTQKCLLVLGVCSLLCYCAAAQHSEITVGFKDIELPRQDDKSSKTNPIKDLGVLMRNLFTLTNKLRSDIRTSTGFAGHHSKHIRSQAHSDHVRRERDGESEPILEVLFERASRSSRKPKDCSSGCNTKNRCKNSKDKKSPCTKKVEPCSKRRDYKLNSLQRKQLQLSKGANVFKPARQNSHR